MRVSAFSLNDSFNYDSRVNSPTGLGNKELQNINVAMDGQGECQTCANRKYVDGSNDMNVSFKAPGYISPGASVAQVSSHEQEHVSNARAEGSKENKELVSASVSIKMARCPECGVSYAAGGVTTTVIRTTTPNYDTNNPYARRQKAIDGQRLAGANIEAES